MCIVSVYFMSYIALVNIFISFKMVSFVWIPWDFLHRQIYNLQRGIVLFLFSHNMYFFYSLSICIALDRISTMILNETCENGHLCLVLNFRRKKFSLYVFYRIFIHFYQVEKVSLYSSFVECFYHKWNLNFVK